MIVQQKDTDGRDLYELIRYDNTDENGNIVGFVGQFKMMVEGVGEVVRTMIDVFFMTMQNIMS